MRAVQSGSKHAVDFVPQPIFVARCINFRVYFIVCDVCDIHTKKDNFAILVFRFKVHI